MANLDQYFSVLALFILFRETIEASIICGVLLQFLARSKPLLKRSVWWGVAAGIGVSLIFGVVFIVVYYTVQSNLFKGKNRAWFKGIISWIAAALITYLGFAMLRFLGWEEKWKRKLGHAIEEKVPEVATLEHQIEEEIKEAEEGDKEPSASSEEWAEENQRPKRTFRARAARFICCKRGDAFDMPMPSRARTPRAPSQQAMVPAAAAAGAAGRASSASTSASPDSAGEARLFKEDTAAELSSGPQPSDAKKAVAGTAVCDAKALVCSEIDPEALKPVSEDSSEQGRHHHHQQRCCFGWCPKWRSPTEGVNTDHLDMTPPTRKEWWNIFILVFTTVVREGIESIVFLGGLGNVQLTAIPLAALVGITSGLLVGVFLFYTGKQVKHLKYFIIIMAVIIFFIAAGQVMIGTDSLMQAGMFGECSVWYDERPWTMQPLYDWSKCCADTDPTGDEPQDVQNRKRLFSLARAIFGYQDKATPIEIFFYCSYWALIIMIALIKWWHGSLLDADYKYNKQQKKLAEEAARKEAIEAAVAAAIEAGANPVQARADVVAADEEAHRPRGLAAWCARCGACWQRFKDGARNRFNRANEALMEKEEEEGPAAAAVAIAVEEGRRRSSEGAPAPAAAAGGISSR